MDEATLHYDKNEFLPITSTSFYQLLPIDIIDQSTTNYDAKFHLKN